MIRIFDRALEAAACLLLLVLLLTVLAGVVSRAAGDPLIWTDEGARLVMVWLACFGWMIAGATPRPCPHPLLPRPVPGQIIPRHGVGHPGGAGHPGRRAGLVRRHPWCAAMWRWRRRPLPISMAWLYVPIIPAALVMAIQSLVQVFEPQPDPIQVLVE